MGELFSNVIFNCKQTFYSAHVYLVPLPVGTEVNRVNKFFGVNSKQF